MGDALPMLGSLACFYKVKLFFLNAWEEGVCSGSVSPELLFDFFFLNVKSTIHSTAASSLVYQRVFFFSCTFLVTLFSWDFLYSTFPSVRGSVLERGFGLLVLRVHRVYIAFLLYPDDCRRVFSPIPGFAAIPNQPAVCALR